MFELDSKASKRGFPARQLLRERRVCQALRAVAGPSWTDFAGDCTARSFLKSLDHLQHRVTLTGAEIYHERSTLTVKVLERCNMPFGQVAHVYVVTHPCPTVP